MRPRFFFLIGKDVERPIGGVMQIYRFANALSYLGYESTVIQDTENFLPRWFNIEPLFKRISFKDYKCLPFSSSSEYLIIPETFVPNYFSLPPVKKIIFNQNAGYTFGEKLNVDPRHVISVYSDSSLSSVICVSHSDYNFLHSCMGVSRDRLFRLNNTIDVSIFNPCFPKEPLISFMPRKNPSHSRVLLGLVESLDSFKSGSWQTLKIENCSLDAVAHHMKRSFLFLSFGFPEGFGLPLAESLACGCRLVGYDGVGGQEIFALASSFDCARSVPVLDFSSYLSSVDYYLGLYNSSSKVSSFYENSLLVSKNVRSSYSLESFYRSCEYFVASLPS
jgi:hypothetical protein